MDQMMQQIWYRLMNPGSNLFLFSLFYPLFPSVSLCMENSEILYTKDEHPITPLLKNPWRLGIPTLKHNTLALASGPWHLLFPLPGVLFPRFLKLSPCASFCYQLTCHNLMEEAFWWSFLHPPQALYIHFLCFYFLCRKLSFKMKNSCICLHLLSPSSTAMSVLDSMSVLFLIITAVPSTK